MSSNLDSGLNGVENLQARESKFSFTYASGTDKGQRRTHNEDCVRSEVSANKEVGIFVVADGVGGSSKGEVASESVVNTIIDLLLVKLQKNPNTDVKLGLREVFTKANEILSNLCYQRACKEIDKVGGDYNAINRWLDNPKNLMATTAVVAFIKGTELTVCNLGDSRAYIVRDGKLGQITDDHTTIETQNGRTKEFLNKAFGVDDNIYPDIFSRKLEPKDKVLMCSDGLSKVLSEHTILQIIAKASSDEEAVRALIAAANQVGGPDNITVTLISIDEKEKERVEHKELDLEEKKKLLKKLAQKLDDKLPKRNQHWTKDVKQILDQEQPNVKKLESFLIVLQAEYDQMKEKQDEAEKKKVDKLMKAISDLRRNSDPRITYFLSHKYPRVENPYDVLNVAMDSDSSQISTVCDRLRLIFHPDTYSEQYKNIATEAFIRVGNARDILSDPIKRKMIDRAISDQNVRQSSVENDFNPDKSSRKTGEEYSSLNISDASNFDGLIRILIENKGILESSDTNLASIIKIIRLVRDFPSRDMDQILEKIPLKLTQLQEKIKELRVKEEAYWKDQLSSTMNDEGFDTFYELLKRVVWIPGSNGGTHHLNLIYDIDQYRSGVALLEDTNYRKIPSSYGIRKVVRQKLEREEVYRIDTIAKVEDFTQLGNVLNDLDWLPSPEGVVTAELMIYRLTDLRRFTPDYVFQHPSTLLLLTSVGGIDVKFKEIIGKEEESREQLIGKASSFTDLAKIIDELGWLPSQTGQVMYPDTSLGDSYTFKTYFSDYLENQTYDRDFSIPQWMPFTGGLWAKVRQLYDEKQ